MNDDYSALLSEDIAPAHLLPKAQEKYARVRLRTLVREYLETFDVKKAAKTARVAEGYALTFLAKPDVQTLINKEIAVIEQMSRVTRVDVATDLRKVADMAMGRVPVKMVTVGSEGAPTTHLVEKTDLSAAKGALELLGKHLAMFVDRQEVDVHLPSITLNLGTQAQVVAHQPSVVQSTASGLSLGPPEEDDDDWID